MTRSFLDEAGRTWFASAREEQTPRHHTRWFLVFFPEGDEKRLYSAPEVRWQTFETAHRTIGSMSDFELRKRLASVRRRTDSAASAAR